MMVQLKKTYRGLNPEMLYDEVRDLVSHKGINAAQARLQTYSIPSGATQSRVTVALHDADGRECGSVHVLSSAGGDARITIDLNDQLVPSDTIQSLYADIDFLLGSYEVKW